MPIGYRFCFICSEQCININSSHKKCGLISTVLKKFFPYKTIPTFRWGNLTLHILSLAYDCLMISR